MASQPSGLAGHLITEAHSDDPGCQFNYFQAYMSFGSITLGAGDTLTLDIALVPFTSGPTVLHFNDANGGTFVEITFEDGRVGGLHYNRSGWNDVTMQLRPATQDFILTVNGAQAGPFPFIGLSCQPIGGCYSVGAFIISNRVGGTIAWIDTLSVLKQSPLGDDSLAQRSFEICGAVGGPEFQIGYGALVLSSTPSRLQSKN